MRLSRVAIDKPDFQYWRVDQRTTKARFHEARTILPPSAATRHFNDGETIRHRGIHCAECDLAPPPG